MTSPQSVTAGADVREASDATSAAPTPAVTPPTQSAPPTESAPLPGPGQLDIHGDEHDWRELFDMAEGVEG